MDIYSRLKDDHGKHRGMAAGLLETSGDSAERRRLFESLKKEIEAHAAAEELTFYAELIAIPDGQEKAQHSISEHKDASDLIARLEEIDMGSSGWLASFKKFKDELDHHMEEEEEEVFVLAKSLIPDTRAEELAAEFEQRKNEALAG